MPHSQNNAFWLGDAWVEGNNIFEYEKNAFAEKIENIYEADLIWVSDIKDPAEK